jgi:lipid II:glycine glycyltransferase (peptidoglycan interpeptide bridge formation enzyme)
MVNIDTTTGGYSTWNCTRGPIFKHDVSTEYTLLYLNTLKGLAGSNKAIACYVSPLQSLEYAGKWRQSPRHEQPEASRVLDLTLSDEELLAQMKPKGRYNIKVANKHNIVVTAVSDSDQYYQLVKLTAQRQKLTPLPATYYQLFLEHVPGAFCLLATHEGKTVAGLIGCKYNQRAYYYYGASDNQYRKYMAPYALQWHAIQQMRQAGATQYDFLGVAPPDSGPNHSWAGITSFKEKFGGTIEVYQPEQQCITKPLVYNLLQLKRKIF